MDKNAERIFNILSIAVTVTGLMHILFSKKRKSSSIQERTGQGSNTNIKGGVNAEEEFKKFILKKKSEGLTYDKAKILEQIARIESRHFKSELLLRTNNIGAITSQQPDSTTLTLYVKPLYQNGVFQGNIITDKYDPQAKPYYYRTYPTLQDGLTAFYNTVVANNYDFKKYSGDKNATLKGIKTPIVDSIYNV